MDDNPARQVRLDGEEASRAQSMGEDVTRALAAVEEMVRSRLGNSEGGYDENQKSIVAIRVFNNDKDIFSDGSTFCGVYDYTAQVCRDCSGDEWALAAQAAQR
jgi:hypothetical protein